MSFIVYKGRADAQHYESVDLRKAGVEDFEGAEFTKDVPVEVSKEVAKALVGNESGLFADFEEVGNPADEPEAKQPEPSAFEPGEVPDYNPDDYTVDEVNEYLDKNPDAIREVIGLEAAEGAQQRKGILEGRHAAAAEEPTSDPDIANEMTETGTTQQGVDSTGTGSTGTGRAPRGGTAGGVTP